jgi:hypothetical protein
MEGDVNEAASSERANKFRAIQVVLKSGQTVAGVRLNEDDLSGAVARLGRELVIHTRGGRHLLSIL